MHFEELITQSYFVVPLLLCSLIGVAVIIHRSLALRGSGIVPVQLAKAVSKRDQKTIASHARDKRSAFARILNVAAGDHGDRQSAEAATQTVAREEVLKLQRGLTTLEVIITIAPLLGLLGTVSGLVRVFSTVGSDGAPSTVGIAQGISEALHTTILGLVIAVPAVIAHSFFQRKIEKLAARMETLTQHFILQRFS